KAMREDSQADPKEKVYVEGSEWLRMANTIIWATGTFLVALSGGCIGWALQNHNQKYFLAAASILLFSFWIYISYLYRRSALIARQVLMNIETEWMLKDETSLYKLQHRVVSGWYKLFNVQIVALIILIVLWIVLLISLRRD